MKAKVGDRLVLESHQLDVARRVGVVTRLQHEDGSPPYWVRWLDTAHEALYVPGPDCHIEFKPSGGQA
ncbi:DUF1918 domain-containing protein [Catelliglobosispora koreensis]|uniref:DUF1918 domain-containing protein n=1 Tax=Catelliglobosispora koreensis TaxID=129052 RepID=UPI00036F337C|nr:DUF1918 domain-containing protein [Catelliglobosispora koreensis]